MRFPLALLILAASLCTSCVNGQLTPVGSAAIVAAEGALCSALLPLASPYLPAGFGAFDALACQGSEAALGAALAASAPAAPAITPASGGASWGPGSVRPLCAVRVSASGRLLGLAPCAAKVTAGHEMGATR